MGWKCKQCENYFAKHLIIFPEKICKTCLTTEDFVTVHSKGFKECTGCKIVKPFSDYHNLKSNKDGKGNRCIPCNKKIYLFRSEATRAAEKKYAKNYYKNNKQKILQNHKDWVTNNKDRVNQHARVYSQDKRDDGYIGHRQANKKHYEENKDKIQQQQKIYRENNKDKISQHRKITQQKNRAKNGDKIRQLERDYYKKNRDRIKREKNINAIKRKVRKKYQEMGLEVPSSVMAEIEKRYGDK